MVETHKSPQMPSNGPQKPERGLGGVRQVFVVSAQGGPAAVAGELAALGAMVSALSFDEALIALEEGACPDAVVLALSDAAATRDISELIDRLGDDVACLAELPADALGDASLPARIDDVIVSPASADELAFRVSRASERRRPHAVEHGVRHGDLVIDQERYHVTLQGHLVELTHKEFQLLTFLSGRTGRVCTRETILSRVWGYDFYGGTRTVDVHIRRLRSKIEDADHSFIDTVRNVGYRFRVS